MLHLKCIHCPTGSEQINKNRYYFITKLLILFTKNSTNGFSANDDNIIGEIQQMYSIVVEFQLKKFNRAHKLFTIIYTFILYSLSSFY